MKFLGHIVSEEGVSTDRDKIMAVKEWSFPRSAKQVRRFLGPCSYYRRFVRNFAQIARLLHKLCKKDSKFLWSMESEDSFYSLKLTLTTAPILAYPQLGQQFILDTAQVSILWERYFQKSRMTRNMSKTMNVHERGYCVTRKELLVVIVALRNFHTYLYDQNVLLRTDNAAVSWVRNLKKPTSQVARWLQELGTYDLTVVHRPGKVHVNAVALSRMPCKACKRQQNAASTQNDKSDEGSEVTELAENIGNSEGTQTCAVTRQQEREAFDKVLSYLMALIIPTFAATRHNTS